MYCSNCGKEVSGNFCSYCGAKLINENNAAEDINSKDTPASDDAYITINDIEVNMNEIIETYGKDKIAAIKYLRAMTGVGLTEGKKIIDGAYDKLYKPETKKGFWETAKEQARLQTQKDIEKKQEREARIKKLDEEGIAYCPKCLSTSLTANKKGFGIGKAVIGAAVTGGIGLVAGNIGAKKVRVTCLKCGHQFWAGKR